MIQTTLSLLIFLFPLAYSPGPGNMFFAASGARFGFQKTLTCNLGYHIATWIVTVAIGFGFASVLGAYPEVFGVLKYAGALFVLRIAWALYRSGTLQGQDAAKPAGFRDGVILLVLNPKAYVIITLMFTQFLGRSGNGQISEVLLIATVFTLNNALAFVIWTLIGDKIAAQFRSPASAGILNSIFAVILAVVAIWMLVS